MASGLIAVILAGGKGERFWPLSRRQRPKQFLCLDGSDRSLLQATADRLVAITGSWESLWVITAGDLAAGVKEQLPPLPETNLLVEPMGKDTAPAVAWATWEISQRFGNEAIVGFFPADHWIKDQDAYQKTLTAAVEMVQKQPGIATLGIKPSYPSTGYGYIEQGENLGSYNHLQGYRVSRFTEKPDAATAAEFIATGRFSWNSGMFIFPAKIMLEQLQTYAPGIIQPIQAQGVASYGSLPKKSIDYAVMEHTRLAYVIPAEFGWDDLGDWNAIARLLQGENPNLELARHIGLESSGNIFYSTDANEIIATIGLEELVVVREKNITLIVPKSRTQEIKQLLAKIQQNQDLEKFL